jgi:DNA-binding cell septation regulator SpoVG
VKIKFHTKDKGPENLLADVEVHLDGSFSGLMISGISLWRGKDGTFVTFPAREYKDKEGNRKFYDHVRSVERDLSPVKNLKQAIVEAWQLESEVFP